MVASLYLVDTDASKNTRIDVYADNVATNSCRIVIRTWADSVTYRAGVSWVAYGT